MSRLYIPDWGVQFEIGSNYSYKNEYEGEVNDGIQLDFHFTRVYTIHLMHTFVPSIMIALSAVLSVYVPSDLVPGRMGLCITAFLSMISLFNGARYRIHLSSLLCTGTVMYRTVQKGLARYVVHEGH